MGSYIVVQNVSVSECKGTLPEATESSFGSNWPRGSTFEPCKEDADSLLACGAIKLAPTDGSDALVDMVMTPLAGFDDVEPEPALEAAEPTPEPEPEAKPEPKYSAPVRRSHK
jgi:hypothetical protein